MRSLSSTLTPLKDSGATRKVLENLSTSVPSPCLGWSVIYSGSDVMQSPYLLLHIIYDKLSYLVPQLVPSLQHQPQFICIICHCLSRQWEVTFLRRYKVTNRHKRTNLKQCLLSGLADTQPGLESPLKQKSYLKQGGSGEPTMIEEAVLVLKLWFTGKFRCMVYNKINPLLLC